MKLYPIALNLENKTCLIIGGGTVASRKTQGLLDAGAIVSLISPDLIVNDARINWIPETYSKEVLHQIKPFLVIVATDKETLNRQITADARSIGAIVNNVSAPEESDFHNMATIQQGNIQLGIHSGASSPALIRYLKEEIASVIDEATGTLSQWLGDLRVIVADSIPNQTDRQAIYRAIVASDVLSLLRDGQVDNARKTFDAIVREHLS